MLLKMNIFWEKYFTESWVYLGNIFSKSVRTWGSSDQDKYFGQSFQVTTPPTTLGEDSDQNGTPVEADRDAI